MSIKNNPGSNDVKVLDYLGCFGPQILFLLSFYLIISYKTFLGFFILGFLLNVILNIILKSILKGARPSEDIRLFNISLNNGKRFGWDKYGMPSGHSQIVGFSTAFLYAVTSNIYILLVYLTLSINTMIQRVWFKNHTVMQVIIGYAVGLLWGLLFFMISKKFIDGNLMEKMDDNAPI